MLDDAMVVDAPTAPDVGPACAERTMSAMVAMVRCEFEVWAVQEGLDLSPRQCGDIDGYACPVTNTIFAGWVAKSARPNCLTVIGWQKRRRDPAGGAQWVECCETEVVRQRRSSGSQFRPLYAPAPEDDSAGWDRPQQLLAHFVARLLAIREF